MSELPPFSCSFSPSFALLLNRLKASIAITTYQAGKLIFISPKNDQELVQLPRTFNKPMGIALQDDKLAVAAQNDVHTYISAGQHSGSYPRRPGVFDDLYIPRVTYHTGGLDLHDIHWTRTGLLAVNTAFSCISVINPTYSFEPVWQPSFITSLRAGDCCHLNGMALSGDELKFVTALGTTDQPGGWRAAKASGGVLIDASTREFVLTGLPMPHSPRLYSDGLFALLSGTGELIKVDPAKGSYEVVAAFDGFVRGMDRVGDYLFIGLSKLRTTSKAFGDLPIASRSLISGVVVFHLGTRKIIGLLKYESSVEEIFDVKVLPGRVRPGILSKEKGEHVGVIVVGDGIYWPMPDSGSDDQMEAPEK